MTDWSKFRHAYGTAEDVPVLLRKLASDDAEERKAGWFEFCSALCHQESVYTATFAVVPDLLDIAVQGDGETREQCLQFVTFSGICRHFNGATDVPAELMHTYKSAVDGFRPLAEEILLQSSDDTVAKVALAYLALSAGRVGLAHGIFCLDKEVCCVNCGALQPSIPYGSWADGR